MNNVNRLDRTLLEEVKKAFVSMPGGADPSMGAGPVAGGGMLTQAQASPMGGTPPMDPSMMGGAGGGGAPMDPSMAGGGAPMDPSMMGGAGGPPPDAGGGMPPPDAGAMPPDAGAMPPPQSQITMSVPDLISLIQALGPAGAKAKTPKAEGGGAAPAAGGGNTSGLEAKIDQLTQMLAGLGGPAAGGSAGGAPAQ